MLKIFKKRVNLLQMVNDLLKFSAELKSSPVEKQSLKYIHNRVAGSSWTSWRTEEHEDLSPSRGADVHTDTAPTLSDRATPGDRHKPKHGPNVLYLKASQH